MTAIIPTAFPEVRHSRQKNEHERAKSEPKQVSVERRKKYGTALVCLISHYDWSVSQNFLLALLRIPHTLVQ